MADFPTPTSASDVWSLQDQYRATAGNNWPGDIGLPGAPTEVSAVAGNASAAVAFTAPTDTGGGTILGYRVTSIPSGITATGSSSPVVISGLSNGTSYTFTVAALNESGYGPESTASNSVTPTSSVAAHYLVVAGGGGGGDRHGGGGGAGGYRTGSSTLTAGTTYSITVGAGGVGGNYEAPTTTALGSGGRGSDSAGFSLTSNGGGGGATYDGYNNGTNRGSGGGGAGHAPYASGQTGTSGQGNSGGTGSTVAPNGGGGGGASAAGGNISGDNGGNGGAGETWLNGITYAGGGGGGAGSSTASGGTGGSGGGGNGAWNDTNTAGTANTGGGGGGSRSHDEPSSGRPGGSGVVILRCAIGAIAASTTGSPTMTTSGSFRFYTFTASGSITF